METSDRSSILGIRLWIYICPIIYSPLGNIVTWWENSSHSLSCFSFSGETDTANDTLLYARVGWKVIQSG
jgi:hypothetical protein